MKKLLPFCEQCYKDVDYDTFEVEVSSKIRGVDVKYSFICCRCKNCGGPVYPVRVGRKNDIRRLDSYKRKVGLLTTEEIIAIRKRNHLTQTQLAERIGCGKKTIARYENGAIQDRIFDNMIRLIDKEPDLILKLLQRPLCN
ncbi:MAG: type II toxin-antitoxin system MqsA family antitoxin [Bacilli bacterium]|nr:type II toxin-antitoxin system MqsA family antitoxin [Bacilli bacterium]